MIEFEWDNKKNIINQKKHNVSFDEAKSAFQDPNALSFYDPDHSKDEDRFILLGISFQLRALVVCHCYKDNEETIRIISARKADKQEKKDYRDELK